MKAISDAAMETFEDVALEGAKHLKAYFTYQGANPAFLQKGKLGASSISGYARIRASETNRMSVELAMKKASAPRQGR